MKEQDESFMSGEEYRTTADKIGLNIRSLGQFLRIAERTTYRYAYETTPVPGPVADLLLLIKSGKVTVKEIEALRAASERKRTNAKRK